MCTAIAFFNVLSGWPVVVGFNRDERYSRRSLPPVVSGGRFAALAPVDPQSGGTWIGVNAAGLFACVVDSSRRKHRGTQSKGRLVQEVLAECGSAEDCEALVSRRDPMTFSSSFLLAMDDRDARLVMLGSRASTQTYARGAHVLCDSDPAGASRRGRWIRDRVRQVGGAATIDEVSDLLVGLLSEHVSCGSRWYTTCCHAAIAGTISSQIIAVDAGGVARVFLHNEAAPCQGRRYREFAVHPLGRG